MRSSALLAYAEDDAGGLMSPRYVRLRPDMSVDEAIAYLRRAARDERVETIYYIYVLDDGQPPTRRASLPRALRRAARDAGARRDAHATSITVRDDLDQEAVAHLIAENNLMAMPVVDAQGQHARAS